MPAVAASQAANYKDLGHWIMPVDPVAAQFLTIRERNGTYEVVARWKGGHQRTIALRETQSSRGRRFWVVGDVAETNYTILKDGTLDIRDQDGKFLIAQPFDGDANSGKAIEEAMDASSAANSNWAYYEDHDQMRKTTSRFAVVESTNVVSFDFPYRGGQAKLILRERDQDGFRIMLSLDSQFMCSFLGNDTISVKFDHGLVERYRCITPQDGTSNMIFIRNEARFLFKLKTAHTLVIEAEFFRAGPRQVEFNVSGLKWD